jgi:acetyl-CoA carboxylase beta subunit
MVDSIVKRKDMKEMLGRLVGLLGPQPADGRQSTVNS